MKRIVTLLIIGTIVVVCSSCEAEKNETTTYSAGGDVIIVDGEGNVVDKFTPTNAAMASAKE